MFLKDFLNKRKTISGQFIYNYKLVTIYVLRKIDNFFFVKYGCKIYKLPLFKYGKVPNDFGNYLDDYFSQEREEINNYKWLLIDYYSTGRLNDLKNVETKKNWKYGD
jgi:hypothetical protein